MLDPLGAVGPFHHDIASSEPFLHISFADGLSNEEVPLFMDKRGFGLKSFFRVENGRQVLEPNLNLLQRFIGGFFIFRRHKRDGFSDEPDLVFCQKGLVLDDDTVLIDAGNVRGSQDSCNPLDIPRLCSIDARGFLRGVYSI